ncbi:MAG TPA: sugar transferase [Solibacterales bacterium]|nr:sugar transferase [Bryobacterales bacterium]
MRSTVVRLPETDTGGPSLRRAVDIVFSLTGLLVLLPALLAFALLIRLVDGPPVLFSQLRVGTGGRLFRLWKFRTMRVVADDLSPRVTAEGDSRVTRLGGFLRRYKIDEFPQLWNVILGQMSLVGPRPEVPEYVEPEDPVWAELLRSGPGLTDFATLVYRHEESVLAMAADPERAYVESVLPHKLRLDREYLRQQTPWTDLKLIILTLRHSFSSAPVNEETIRRQIFGGDRWKPSGPFLIMSRPSAKRKLTK